MEKCPICGETNLYMVEYAYGHPEHYDGVSEYRCPSCGKRFGRWSGKILADDESEKRWGGKP